MVRGECVIVESTGHSASPLASQAVAGSLGDKSPPPATVLKVGWAFSARVGSPSICSERVSE